MKASRGREYQKQLATNRPWRVQGELTCHGEQNYSRGELRRPNPSKLTWQKPTGKESSTREASKLPAMANKRPFTHFRRKIYHIIGHLRERKQGKTRENLRSKEHKD
ncbi:hypothetical protein MTR_5g023480 [Medicago truncatula]|uniref:Uncharacterized protein n=1 Tax=Medicago truncatula TaxID=3880 RepID=G7JZZ0_MEDTR|nr:hypothetical protein MTR_5g023480 [Medicago truncatula]